MTGLSGGGEGVWRLGCRKAEDGEGRAFLDPQTAQVMTVPRRIVAATVGMPEHRHRQRPRVFQRQDHIAFAGADKGRPAEGYRRVIDRGDKVILRVGPWVFQQVDGRAIGAGEIGGVFLTAGIGEAGAAFCGVRLQRLGQGFEPAFAREESFARFLGTAIMAWVQTGI